MSRKTPPDDLRPALGPIQFRLSTMMLVVALLCGLFALLGSLSPYGGLVLVLLVLAVAGHVAGNALGTRLRDLGDTPMDEEGCMLPPPTRLRQPVAPSEVAPTTLLSRRRSLGMVVTIITGLGVMIGAGLGGFLLARFGHEPHLTSIGFAILFCGALGGIVCFLAGSFIRVAIAALWQAERESTSR